MPTVKSEIRRILKDKDRGIRTGTEAILDILENLRGQVIDDLGRAAVTDWDTYHLNQMLSSIESRIKDFSSKARAEAGGLLDKSWDLGKLLVDAPLAGLGISTGFTLSATVLETLKDFAFHKIEGLSDSAWDKIRGELTLGIMGGKTPQEVASAIGKNLDGASIFGSIARRAEVITKMEMGRTFSTAAQKRMEDAADHVDGLEKMWRHVGHPMKPRPEHLAADGQHVPVNEPFLIGGIEMMYPRDPGAPLEEVINCG